ncbi:MAG TPA: hypothetical protein VGL83_13695 [Stellaceae bacterium]|jgi:hypothetical protein
MRMLWPVLILVSAALGGCSLPAPYQTYSPSDVPPPSLPTSALVVYGATTTTSDMVPDSAEPEPVPVTAAPAGDAGKKSDGISICYNRLWNSPDAIKSAAAQACGNTTMSPRIISQNIDLDACPVLTPTKAVFSCGTAPPAP